MPACPSFGAAAGGTVPRRSAENFGGQMHHAHERHGQRRDAGMSATISPRYERAMRRRRPPAAVRFGDILAHERNSEKQQHHF